MRHLAGGHSRPVSLIPETTSSDRVDREWAKLGSPGFLSNAPRGILRPARHASGFIDMVEVARYQYSTSSCQPTATQVGWL
jgi:hypothetical protein